MRNTRYPGSVEYPLNSEGEKIVREKEEKEKIGMEARGYTEKQT